MPARPLSDEQLITTLEALRDFGTQSAVAQHLNLSERSIRNHLAEARERGLSVPRRTSHNIQAIQPSDDVWSRCVQQSRESAIAEHDPLSVERVQVPHERPFHIGIIGDPHLDSPGCNFAKLHDDLEALTGLPDCYLINIGDILDNWAGRLKAEYAKSEISQDAGIALAKEFLTRYDWLVHILGNHDEWESTKYFIMSQTSAMVTNQNGVRLEFVSSNGAATKVWARHDWPGQSIYNKTHGANRVNFQGADDHLIVSGHKHGDAEQGSYNPYTGRYGKSIMVGGYKVIDGYSERFFGPSRQPFNSRLVTINPQRPDNERVLIHNSIAGGVIDAQKLAS